MARFMAFILLCVSIFFGFIYSYDDERLIDYMTPGFETEMLSEDKISIELVGEVTEHSDEIELLITNHTSTEYVLRGTTDLEVYTNGMWYDALQNSLLRPDEPKGALPAGKTTKITLKGIAFLNIQMGYNYRIVLTMTDKVHDPIYSAVEFYVSKKR